MAAAAGVTKASALADIATQQGLGTGDVIAFGDMPNDRPMLTWAGMSYAVANAYPDVLAAADHTVPANDKRRRRSNNHQVDATPSGLTAQPAARAHDQAPGRARGLI